MTQYSFVVQVLINVSHLIPGQHVWADNRRLEGINYCYR